MPRGHILVGDSTRHVKHDDCAISLDVVTVSQSSKLLLSSTRRRGLEERRDIRVPGVEADWAKVGVKNQGIDLGANGRNILFLEFTSEMTFYKGGLSGSSVACSTNEREQCEYRRGSV
jgi:hypothetical protein